MRIKEILSEGLSPVLFHATSANSFLKILESNKFRLSEDPVSEYYYMSFSRNKTNQFIPYLLDLDDAELEEEGFNPRRDMYVVMTIDGRKLSTGHRGKPFSTHYMPPDDDFPDLNDPDFEREWSFQEDRLLSKKPVVDNASSYIKHVSVVVNDDIDRDAQSVVDVVKGNKELLRLVRATKDKFTISLYATTDDYIKNRSIAK